jgi:ketosteroid isomerase-like protein
MESSEERVKGPTETTDELLERLEERNEALVERFYAAFAARDGATMAACYAPGATFSDPVFTNLSLYEPGAMWRMLTGRAQDLEVALDLNAAGPYRGMARWRATYTYSQTGRRVVNYVRADFQFADGAITDHVDAFDFHRWARQALGTPGLLLGWTPMFRAAVRRRARATLHEFMLAERTPPVPNTPDA